jgi:nucleoside-diphosphate-sugar epimerase
MSRVLVTGPAGFIGSHVARRLRETGASVVGVSRSKLPLRQCESSYVRSFHQPLGEILCRQPVDAVIHCAHDLSQKGSGASEQGTILWAEEAHQAGVNRQIFVSSISARPDARAAYGQVKYRLERWFLGRGAAIVRLGLVIGNGGLFGRMARIVRNSAMVPLIDSGRTRVFYSGVDFVSRQIAAAALDWRERAELNLQQPEPTTMRELMLALREALGTSTRFVPVPYLPVLAAAWVLDCCKIRGLGISYENVVGLRQNDVAAMHSDFLSQGGEPLDIRVLVKQTIAACPI